MRRVWLPSFNLKIFDGDVVGSTILLLSWYHIFFPKFYVFCDIYSEGVFDTGKWFINALRLDKLGWLVEIFISGLVPLLDVWMVFLLCSITVKFRLFFYVVLHRKVCLFGTFFFLLKNALFSVLLWMIRQFEIWDWLRENALEATSGRLLPCYLPFSASLAKRSLTLLVCVLKNLHCAYFGSLKHSTHVRSFVNQMKPKGSAATAAWPLVCWTGWKCCTVPGLNSGFTRKLSMICCSMSAYDT